MFPGCEENVSMGSLCELSNWVEGERHKLRMYLENEDCFMFPMFQIEFVIFYHFTRSHDGLCCF